MDLRQLLTREPADLEDGVLEFAGKSTPDPLYASSFGIQWNRYRAMQIDSESGSRESHDRFHAETGWRREDLAGKVLLDAGCGAGRFAEVALEAGAFVVAVDLTEAATACRRTLARFPPERYLILRADLFDLPLAEGAFDGIYSLGVLQHTPDPLLAIRRLSRHLAPGGRLAVWIYRRPSALIRVLQPRQWIRALTGGWSDGRKLSLSRFLTAAFFPAGWALSWFGRPGQILSYFLPYAARHHLGRGDWARQWHYSVMDTFDWYGPRYELTQREEDVVRTMVECGLAGVRRLPARGMAIAGEAPIGPT